MFECLAGARTVHIAFQALFGAVDGHIDEHGTLLEVFGLQQPRVTGGGDDDVGDAREVGEVAGVRVAEGDGGVLTDEELGGGFAHQLAASDDDGVLAGHLYVVGGQQGENALGGAGHHVGLAQMQQSHIHQVQSVGILAVVNGIQNLG